MRVLVAMSGGVDSSVAAALLLDEGHSVVGCTLQLWGGSTDTGCCSAADVEDARRVAQVLGINHHVFNLQDEFGREVVDTYVSSHADGGTPNPCVACNRSIKFGALLDRAVRLGFDAVATGHHARITRARGGPELRRGLDAAKDQSYVLGFLGAGQLERTLLPVGERTKAQIRAIAAERSLRTAAKPDSQDVCFIPRGGRPAFLGARAALTPAVVVDARSGAALGEVPAAELVTAGQRRGVARGTDGTARYVVDVDVAAATVVVASLDDAMTDELELRAASLTSPRGSLRDGARVRAQLSAHGHATSASLRLATRCYLELDSPVRPVALGQLAVLYDEDDPDLVVGSAVVARRALLA